MSEQHNLRIDTRENSLNCDGRCSCLKMRWINRSRTDIREAHAQHVQEMLGPDGTERKER